jgi:hypothetical protein
MNSPFSREEADQYFKEPGIPEPEFSHIVSDIEVFHNSSTEYAKLARRRLNRWIADWDYQDKKDVLARLESTDAAHHDGAVWELFLNSYFKYLGFHVIRDPLATKGNSPDFLLQKFFTKVYLEATSRAKNGNSAHHHHWVSIVNSVAQIKRDDFQISLRATSVSIQPPKTSKFISEINSYLDSLDFEKISKESESFLHSRAIQVQEWGIEIGVLPKKERTTSGPFIGICGNVDSFMISDLQDLKKKIQDKRSKYGYLEHPYLIAVLENSFIGGVDKWHRVGALFGEEALRISPEGSAQTIRKNNGVWNSRKPDSRVHGLILLGRLSVSLHNWEHPELWVNPAASTGKVRRLIPLATLLPESGSIKTLSTRDYWDGISTGSLKSRIARWFSKKMAQKGK